MVLYICRTVQGTTLEMHINGGIVGTLIASDVHLEGCSSHLARYIWNLTRPINKYGNMTTEVGKSKHMYASALLALLWVKLALTVNVLTVTIRWTAEDS